MVNYSDMDFSQFMPEGFGQYETFNVSPGRGRPMTGAMMGDTAALYKRALGKEAAVDMQNQKYQMMMRQMMNVLPQLARTHRGDPMAMGMAQGLPPMMADIAPVGEANTGGEEFLAGIANEMAMAEAQGNLMDYLRELEKQPWYKEWAPVIGSIFGAILGGPLGSSIGGGLGETYARSDL
jgi:hypothetical protein